MKRQWDAEELIENFTLTPEEIALLDNKSEVNRLGKAVLLKFFQMEARFPRKAADVPSMVVSYIARLLSLSPQQYKEYSFDGRTIERHRADIRLFFGFRKITSQDKEELKTWLSEKVLAYDRTAAILILKKIRENSVI